MTQQYGEEIQMTFFFLMVTARRIVLAISVPAATCSTMVIRTLGSRRRRPGCSVVFLWNTGVGTLANVG